MAELMSTLASQLNARPGFPANRTPTGASVQLIDPRLLMRIRNLEFRARIVVEGFWNGLHRSRQHGFSVEFTEYRQYTPGDDLRYLDWRVFARSDRYFIKRFEDETNLRCHLVADQSPSMSFGTIGHSKAQYAATLAAALAYFLHLQKDAVGLLTFSERVREYLPARHRPGHLRRLLVALERSAPARATDLLGPLEFLVQAVPKRGLIVLVSDLLAPIDRLERALSQLTACGHEIVVFQILDPAELEFGFADPALFQDLESEATLALDPGAARGEYLRQLERHSNAARNLCQKLGHSYARLSTGAPLELALLEFFKARAQRRRHGRRATGGPLAAPPSAI